MESQRESRNEWKPEIQNGVCINGCCRETVASQSVQRRLIESAQSAEFAWERKGEMPIVKWDASFEAWLDSRIAIVESYIDRGICLWPWRILAELPSSQKASDRLFWSQGNIGSCMSHANTFAFQCSTLIEIALGAPLVYRSFNPIVPFWLSKGRSLRGGQTVSEMAEWTHTYGQYPEEWVGKNNLSIPRGWEDYEKKATDYQNGICFLEENSPSKIAEKILRGCRAGLAFSFGNSHAVRGAKIDKNGIKAAVLGGRWAHATSISSYRKVGNTEYVFWQNSHGPIYEQSDEGEPADGAWMNDETLEVFAQSIADYGYIFCHFVEGETRNLDRIDLSFRPTFPQNWIR